MPGTALSRQMSCAEHRPVPGPHMHVSSLTHGRWPTFPRSQRKLRKLERTWATRWGEVFISFLAKHRLAPENSWRSCKCLLLEPLCLPSKFTVFRWQLSLFPLVSAWPAADTSRSDSWSIRFDLLKNRKGFARSSVCVFSRGMKWFLGTFASVLRALETQHSGGRCRRVRNSRSSVNTVSSV